MLDIKKIREEYEEVKKAIESRGQGSFGIENILQLDDTRRSLLATVEQMKNRQKLCVWNIEPPHCLGKYW